jgi:membrane protein
MRGLVKVSVAEKLVSLRLLCGNGLRKFFTDDGLFLASALAFNLLLYFIPLSLLMISLLGYTVLDSERAMNEVQSVLKAFLPRSQQALADNLAAVVANRGLLGFFGFASFFIFSTFLFGSVRTVLNRVFQVKEERTLVRGMGVDLLMMGLTALLVLFAVGTSWFLTVAGAFTERYPSWSGLLQPGLVALSKVMNVGATGLLFYVLYRFPPVATLSAWALVIASVTGTLLFQCAKWGFAWYVAASQENLDLYGALGGLMFLFAWLYYASVVFIVGAEVGWAYDQQRVGLRN